MAAAGPSEAPDEVEPEPTLATQALSTYGYPVRELGKGTYGSVFLTSQGYAIKVIPLGSSGLSPVKLSEIVYPLALHHPLIVKYHAVDLDFEHNQITLVMDRAVSDLQNLVVETRAGVDLSNFALLAQQLVVALAYLASRNVIHRDIKPENILLHYVPTPQGDLAAYTIADFGLATGRECILQLFEHDVYSLWYRPPEILLQLSRYGVAADVWALGLTLYFAYTRSYLFQGDDNEDMLLRILRRLGLPKRTSRLYQPLAELVNKYKLKMPREPVRLVPEPAVNRFLLRMLQIDPEQRASIFDLQDDPLYRKIEATDQAHVLPVTPIPANRCPSRLALFDRHFDYTVAAEIDKTLSAVIKNLYLFKQAFRTSAEEYSLAVELLYKYLVKKPEYQKVEILQANWRIFSIVVLSLAVTFLGPINRQPNLDSYNGRLSQKIALIEFQAVKTSFLEILNYDLNFTTVCDRILVHEDLFDPPTLTLATEILAAVAPYYYLYFYPHIAEACLLLAARARHQEAGYLTHRYAESLAFISPLVANIQKLDPKYFSLLDPGVAAALGPPPEVES